MKRTVQILAIVSAAIMAVTLSGMLLVVLFQNSFVKIYGLPEEAIGYFVIPFSHIFRLLFMLVATILLCITIHQSKCGIVFEIVFVAAVLLALPAFNLILQFIEPIMTNSMGTAMIAKNSYVNMLCNHVSLFYPLAQGMSLLACGMSIGRKCTKKF